MAWDLLSCTEENKLLLREQYGSRKGHQAILQALNKRLLYDLNQLSRYPMILCSKNAKSCYNQIVHSITSLVLQRLGMPVELLIIIFGTI